MSDIISTIRKLFEIFNAFMPPAVFYVVVPFVALMAFFRIVREVK